MELVYSTNDCILMECRYTIVFSIFSYAVKNDHLSMIYFKQRDLLYKTMGKGNASEDIFLESLIKNIIICMSSVILKINASNLSLC